MLPSAASLTKGDVKVVFFCPGLGHMIMLHHRWCSLQQQSAAHYAVLVNSDLEVVCQYGVVCSTVLLQRA